MRRTVAGCLVALALLAAVLGYLRIAAPGPTASSAGAIYGWDMTATALRTAVAPPSPTDTPAPTAAAAERSGATVRPATPTRTAAAAPSPTATPSVRPLSALSPAASALVAGGGDDAGAIVIFPASGAAYGSNQDADFRLASVAKVVIMLALLDQHERDGAALDDATMADLRAMITESDNDSADALWQQIGGGAGAQAYLQSAGIAGITMSATPAWGDSTGTPHAVAELFAALASGTTLDLGGRALALALLVQVDPGQAWGARLAFPPTATVGIKNGWVPDEDGGWYMHSAAVDESDPAHPVVVVMTGDEALPLEAIARIQAIAAAIGGAIQGGASAGR